MSSTFSVPMKVCPDESRLDANVLAIAGWPAGSTGVALRVDRGSRTRLHSIVPLPIDATDGPG